MIVHREHRSEVLLCTPLCTKLVDNAAGPNDSGDARRRRARVWCSDR
jgi:hypothetical protein